MEFLIPIIGTLSFFGTVVLIVYISVQAYSRKNKYLHEEKMLAIDKGVDVPMVTEVKGKHKQHNPFVWPFIFIGVGLALVIGDIIDADYDTISVIPLFIGSGMLLAHYLMRKDKKKAENEIEAEEAPVDFKRNF